MVWWYPGGRVDFYHIIYIILNPLVIMPIFHTHLHERFCNFLPVSFFVPPGPLHLLLLRPVSCPVSFCWGPPLTFTSCFLSYFLLVGSTSYLYFLFPALFPYGSGPPPTFTSCFLSCFLMVRSDSHLSFLFSVLFLSGSGPPPTFTSCFLSCFLLFRSTSYL